MGLLQTQVEKRGLVKSDKRVGRQPIGEGLKEYASWPDSAENGSIRAYGL